MLENNLAEFSVQQRGAMKTLWKVGSNPTPVERSQMPSEKELEQMLVANLRILSPDWMLIGNQVSTGTGFIDVLAVSRDGTVVVVELKRDKASRDVVSQTLDYVSWISGLQAETIGDIYSSKQQGELGAKFKEYFGTELNEEMLNVQQQAVIVASQPDLTTERIVKYLATLGVPINLNTFEVFIDGAQLYLSPNWVVDLAVTQGNVASVDEKGPWNGHHYGSFGHGQDDRNWEDACKYGFFSAGGGAWYSRSLSLLQTDDIIWVQSPSDGYIGVGRVLSSLQPFEEFVVQFEGKECHLSELPLNGNYVRGVSADDDLREFMVGIEWLHTVPIDEAVRQVGFFGNQNSVCRPRVAKWTHTVNTLKSKWKIDFDR
jgi:hypothetical protein